MLNLKCFYALSCFFLCFALRGKDFTVIVVISSIDIYLHQFLLTSQSKGF